MSAGASAASGAPAYACDSHIHIYDRRFHAQSGASDLHFPVSDYRKVQQRTGTTRTVVVTPRIYGTDPACILDAIAQLGRDSARGIAVVHPDVAERNLQRMADGGIRGIRFTLEHAAQGVTTVEMIEPLARRVQPLGWHLQLHMTGAQIADHAALLERLTAPIVFDHLGRLPYPEGIRHPAYSVIRRLLDRGHTWIKLSGTVFEDAAPGAPLDAQSAEIARAYIAAAPERIVWGSDWPHRAGKDKKDDVELLGLVTQWAPDATTRQRILVDNPQSLYGFPKGLPAL